MSSRQPTIPPPSSPSRVLANVQFLTWAPSQGGQINTTKMMAAGISVWVNNPEDMRFPREERGAEHATALAVIELTAQRVDIISITLVQVTTQLESTILNQPKMVVDSGTGMKIIKSEH